FPPPSRHVALAGARARCIDRRPQFIPQSFEPERFCVDRGLVVGGIATWRSLSAVGDIGRAGLGKDSPKVAHSEEMRRLVDRAVIDDTLRSPEALTMALLGLMRAFVPAASPRPAW